MAQSTEPLELSPFNLFWGQDGLRQHTGVCLRKVWLLLVEVLGGLRVKPEGSHAGTSLSEAPSQVLGRSEAYAIVNFFLISPFPPHFK